MVASFILHGILRSISLNSSILNKQLQRRVRVCMCLRLRSPQDFAIYESALFNQERFLNSFLCIAERLNNSSGL